MWEKLQHNHKQHWLLGSLDAVKEERGKKQERERETETEYLIALECR